MDGRFTASKLRPALPRFGHNRPVELTFQFLLVGRPGIELSGRYSASKKMTALAQPGHNQPYAKLGIGVIERLLHTPKLTN